jgi:hypothetical protein
LKQLPEPQQGQIMMIHDACYVIHICQQKGLRDTREDCGLCLKLQLSLEWGQMLLGTNSTTDGVALIEEVIR